MLSRHPAPFPRAGVLILMTDPMMHLTRATKAAACFLAVLHLMAAHAATPTAVVGWGDNSYGESTLPAGVSNVMAIAAGYENSLALQSNGIVIAWGAGDEGQTNVPSGLSGVVAVATTQFHCLALKSNGTVVAWGRSSEGQTNVPAGLSGVKAIAAGFAVSLALKSNGTVVAWGSNLYGPTTNVPPGVSNIAAIAAGFSHSLVLRSNGTVFAWGSGASQTNVPVGLSGVAAIAAAGGFNMALRSNSTVVAWGDNSDGQTNVPAGLSNVIAIAAGEYHGLALKSDGTVAAWGRNYLIMTNVPDGLSQVVGIASGSFHNLALRLDNDNFAGRLPIAGTNIAVLTANAGATREPNEPQHYTKPSSNSVWFTWTAPSSGGVVVQVTNNAGFNAPIVAVYTGASLTSLTRQAYNSSASNDTPTPVARAVFTAVAGQVYQIAVDSIGGSASLTVTLILSPPPANDLFANGAPVSGTFFETAGYFVGADREPGEPAHGEPTFGQTLWWVWAAPTNGPDPQSVRLLADGVSFPPGMGVYTGNSVSSLTPLSFLRRTNGMSSDAIFSATPGTTYHIALAGKESDPDSTASVIGYYRFRLNCRMLGLTITNLIATTNSDGSVPFQANAQIQNVGTVASSPLRVSLSAISGLSTTRPLSSVPVSTQINLGTFPVSPVVLAPGQSMLVHITGTAPAPDPADLSKPIAYGVYADLQEQPISNRWFTVDETLVTFDRWPGIGEVFGPGGGVIRLDPSYVGLSPFNPLSAMAVQGATQLNEGSSTRYTGKATYADNSTVNFSNTTWTASRFAITTNGVFMAGSVTANTVVSIGAPYACGGYQYTASTNVTVLNLPPPTLTSLKLLTNGTLTLTLNGVPGRSHVIETTTNLSAPTVWLPLTTNAVGTNGILSVTNSFGTNALQRFYRAREFP